MIISRIVLKNWRNFKCLDVQLRERVFVVGYLGDWRRAAEVLFEPASLSGDPAPCREARENIAGPLGGSAQRGGFRTTDLDNQGAYIPEIVPQAMSAKWVKQSSGPSGDEVAHLVAFADLADPVAANQARTYTREGTHNFRLVERRGDSERGAPIDGTGV